MQYQSWVVVFIVEALATVVPVGSICQLSRCSSHPQRYQLCSSTYRGIDLWPISPQKFQLTPRGGHIFDLFYEPSGTGCSSVNVFVDLNEQHLDIFLAVSCANFNISIGLAYTALNLSMERCVRLYDVAPDFTKSCSYHQSEQIRFTIIDNETFLVEDLSLLMPPGTRMIFRTAKNVENPHRNLSKCRCWNVFQDMLSYKQCGRYHLWLHESLGEFLISLGIVVGAVLVVFVGLWWATRVRDYQIIEYA